MIDGIYEVSLKTPMGVIQGEIGLETKNGVVNASIETMGMKNTFQNGKLMENRFSFSGDLATPFGRYSYEAIGEVRENELQLNIQTKQGNWIIEGKRKK